MGAMEESQPQPWHQYVPHRINVTRGPHQLLCQHQMLMGLNPHHLFLRAPEVAAGILMRRELGMGQRSAG